MTEQTVDLSNLRSVTDGDKELERELFEQFIMESGKLVTNLKSLCNSDADNESWRRTAHALQGISLNLGAETLGGLGRIGQDEFSAGAGRKQELVEKITLEYSRVVDFLNAEMNG
jgi:HPt (histidine-containing phosphotransfer) domain-containing protein